MSDPIHHAMSSAKRFGGNAEDYLAIHEWFDETKASMPDIRHRAMRHHAEGIKLCMITFGPWVETTVGGRRRFVSVRMIAEQHIIEDLGHIPTMADWLREMPMKSWMMRKAMAQPHKGKLRSGDAENSYDPIQEMMRNGPRQD